MTYEIAIAFIVGSILGALGVYIYFTQQQILWRARVMHAEQLLQQESQQRDSMMASLSDRFKTLADEVIELKGRRFAEQNEKHIGQMVLPIQEKLREFKEIFENARVLETAERAALGAEVHRLYDLSRVLSQETHRLSESLQKSSKVRGDWGEVVLERILESAGLRAGQDYVLQNHNIHEDGTRVRPDVIIHLPRQRHIVIDAKVTLPSYIDWVNATTDDDRKVALKRLVAAMRTHVKSLSEKRYHAIPNVSTPEFTLMFVPIEGAFMAVVGSDEHFLTEAWKMNILPASPSTLMFALQTVAYLWRQDERTKNVEKIAERGAYLFDKISEFANEINKIGQRLDQAQEAYQLAKEKLLTQKGSIASQARMLQELGVQGRKQLVEEVTGV